jgi:hypothetical protein
MPTCKSTEGEEKEKAVPISDENSLLNDNSLTLR